MPAESAGRAGSRRWRGVCRVALHPHGELAGNRLEVGVLDIAPVEDIIAHQESSRLLAPRPGVGLCRSGHAVATVELRPQHDLPQPVLRLLDRHQEWSFDANRVVVARRYLKRGIEVVDDIDAADESDLAVNHRQLAVQTAQAMATQLEARNVGPVDHRLDTGREQGRLQTVGKVPGAKAIDQHPHCNAASSSPGHRLGDRTPGPVILENIAFKMHFMPCAVDRSDQRGKILGAAVEQGQPVARQEPSSHRVGSDKHAARLPSSARRPRRPFIEAATARNLHSRHRPEADRASILDTSGAPVQHCATHSSRLPECPPAPGIRGDHANRDRIGHGLDADNLPAGETRVRMRLSRSGEQTHGASCAR